MQGFSIQREFDGIIVGAVVVGCRTVAIIIGAGATKAEIVNSMRSAITMPSATTLWFHGIVEH
jgi:hypothetical protein